MIKNEIERKMMVRNIFQDHLAGNGCNFLTSYSYLGVPINYLKGPTLLNDIQDMVCSQRYHVENKNMEQLTKFVDWSEDHTCNGFVELCVSNKYGIKNQAIAYFPFEEDILLRESPRNAVEYSFMIFCRFEDKKHEAIFKLKFG